MKMLKSIICWNLSHMKPISFRCLTYTIPGLDVFEQNYVKSQVDTIVNFDYLSECREMQKGEKKVMDLLPNKRLTVLLDQLELKNEKVRNLCFENGTNKEERYRRDITFFMQGCVKKFHMHPSLNTVMKLVNIQQNHPENLKMLKQATGKSALSSIINDSKFEICTTKPIKKINICEGLDYDSFINELSALNITQIKLHEEINFMRNLYILTRLLNIPLGQILEENVNSDDKKLDLVLNLFQAHSLEVLIQLNVFDEILLKTVKYEAEKNAILQNLAFSTFYPFKAFKIKQKYQLSPVVYYSQLITSAGYSMQTVRYLFGSNQNFMHIFLKKMELKLKLLNYDFLTISARLSESSQVLEATNLSSENECEEIKLMKSIYLSNHSSIDQSAREYFLKSNWTTGNLWLGLKRKSLADYVTSKYGELANANLNRASHKQSLERCTFWASMNLNMIEILGFTHQQIATGTQVLTYPPMVLRNMMQQMEENPEDYPGLDCSNWRDDPKALLLVCYYIERSSDFPKAILKKQSLKPSIILNTFYNIREEFP